MGYRAQDFLRVAAATTLSGIAGLWLVSHKVSGAIAIAAAGGSIAIVQIQQEKTLRRLKSKNTQLQPDNAYQQAEIQNFTELVARNRTRIEEILTATQLHSNKLNAIEKSSANQVTAGSFVAKDFTEDIKKLNAQVATLSASMAASKPSVQTSGTVAPAAIDADEEASVDKSAQAVISWFAQRKIEVENYYEPDPTADRLLDGLSLYLGDNYTVLKKLHWKLRSSVGKTAHLELANYAPREKRIHKQYLEKLKACDYLSRGRLVERGNGHDFITTESYNRPDIQGFFDGGWFERFVYDKVIALLDFEGVNYECLRNSSVVYENNQKAEFDLFFLIDGEPLLIECKAGHNYHAGIEKFNSYGQYLSLGSSNAIFVVLDIDEAEAHIRNKNWNITVADQNDFLEQIKKLIATSRRGEASSEEEDYDDETIEPTSVGRRDERSDVERFLKRLKLNLSPESRPPIFQELIRFFEQFNTTETSITFNELTKAMRDRMEPLSRTRISEVLYCLFRSDLFRDENNKPVGNTNDPIYSIASLDPELFEQKCMEFYAEKILQAFDPDFFDESENIFLFEKLTLGKAPSADTIEHLIDHLKVIKQE